MDAVLRVIEAANRGEVSDKVAIRRIADMGAPSRVAAVALNLLADEQYSSLQLIVQAMVALPKIEYCDVISTLLRVRHEDLPLDDVIDYVYESKDRMFIEPLTELVKARVPGDDFRQINKNAFLALRSLGVGRVELAEIAVRSGVGEIVSLQTGLGVDVTK